MSYNCLRERFEYCDYCVLFQRGFVLEHDPDADFFIRSILKTNAAPPWSTLTKMDTYAFARNFIWGGRSCEDFVGCPEICVEMESGIKRTEPVIAHVSYRKVGYIVSGAR